MHWIKQGSLFLVLLLPHLLFADALIVSQAMKASTIAEVFIEQKAVRVELEIGMGDIPAFKNILPDAIFEKLGNDPSPIVQRRERFFREDFVIEADGAPLRGGVLQMEPRKRLKRDDVTGEPLPNQGDGKDILFAELVFPMAGKPKALSIKPPIDKERGLVSASIGLMTYHMDLPVMDFRYLGRKEIIQLDWEDPWYSQFENKNLRRQYREPISAFLYAEHFETRVEVIVRPKDLQQWTDLGIEGAETLSVEVQEKLKQQVPDFLLSNMELEIDGQKVVPELQRVNFLRRTLRSSTVIDPPEAVDTVSATMGIIYSVPTAGLPKESRLSWNLFSPKMQVVRSASVDEAGPLPYKLRPDDNVLIWKNFLKNPTVPGLKPLNVPEPLRAQIPLAAIWVIALLTPVTLVLLKKKNPKLVGYGLMAVLLLSVSTLLYIPMVSVSLPFKQQYDDESKTELVDGLLNNVYASFDLNGESAVYDALDQSLAGELLSDVYLQTMKSLELASQGGARVKVKGVSLEEATFSERDKGFRAECIWDVKGSVGHWGHIHERVNRYSAEVDVQQVVQTWKIVALNILEEQRVK